MKPTLMNSWLLNTVYFCQFGCCKLEILLFFQDKSRLPIAECDTTFIGFIDLDESNSIVKGKWHNWCFDFSLENCDISGL